MKENSTIITCLMLQPMTGQGQSEVTRRWGIVEGWRRCSKQNYITYTVIRTFKYFE